jgi:hypothetical protein
MTRSARSASVIAWGAVVLADFDRYCDEHDITLEEAPAAFAAWLNGATGWDGGVEQTAADSGSSTP